MAGARQEGLQVVVTKNRDAPGPFLIVCEHASNHFPAAFGMLGLSPEARSAHVAWDPGALGVARRLARLLDAPLIAAGVSRLIYDLNRPPNSAGAMVAQSETFEIPGNSRLSASDRWRRTEAVYLPFHAALRTEMLQLRQDRDAY